MARASAIYRQAAQAEDRNRREITSAPSADQKKAIESRLKTAMSLYSKLKPIADKHGADVLELIALHAVETRGKGDPMSRESGAGATGGRAGTGCSAAGTGIAGIAGAAGAGGTGGTGAPRSGTPSTTSGAGAGAP